MQRNSRIQMPREMTREMEQRSGCSADELANTLMEGTWLVDQKDNATKSLNLPSRGKTWAHDNASGRCSMTGKEFSGNSRGWKRRESWNSRRMHADIRLRTFRRQPLILFGIHAEFARPCRQNLTHGQLNADFERVPAVATLGFCTPASWKTRESISNELGPSAMKADDQFVRSIRTRPNVSWRKAAGE